MKKWLIILTLILLFVALFFALGGPKLLGEQITSYYTRIRDYPKTGTYYCEEISMKIDFQSDGTFLIYPNGEKEEAHIDFGGRILGESSGIVLFYRWIQEENYIKITVSKEKNILPDNAVYYFY